MAPMDALITFGLAGSAVSAPAMIADAPQGRCGAYDGADVARILHPVQQHREAGHLSATMFNPLYDFPGRSWRPPRKGEHPLRSHRGAHAVAYPVGYHEHGVPAARAPSMTSCTAPPSSPGPGSADLVTYRAEKRTPAARASLTSLTPSRGTVPGMPLPTHSRYSRTLGLLTLSMTTLAPLATETTPFLSQLGALLACCRRTTAVRSLPR